MDLPIIGDTIREFHDTGSLREIEVLVGARLCRIYREDDPDIGHLSRCKQAVPVRTAEAPCIQRLLSASRISLACRRQLSCFFQRSWASLPLNDPRSEQCHPA